jgi:hypothetical protein
MFIQLSDGVVEGYQEYPKNISFLIDGFVDELNKTFEVVLATKEQINFIKNKNKINPELKVKFSELPD